ncbi:unnamed protein product [Thelazia callipaeda]|uniref:Uncharacterized protein n=1 Tax=Thelazia callipaeda TaxID=103827 RepID=A0A0N5CTJ3_THECL|nr:unnamed protein product [Thelazia callipaeda]
MEQKSFSSSNAISNHRVTCNQKEQQLLLESLSRTQCIVEQSHTAIRSNSNQLNNFLTEGDLDGILLFYDSDVELLESQTPLCRGIDGNRFILIIP